MSLFPNEDILTKEIESWKGYASSLHADNRELFMTMLNDCYKYAVTAINAKGEPFPSEPLIMALLLSQHKMIDWLTKEISKYESLVNNKAEVKKAKEEERLEDLGRENKHDYIRKNERINYIDD
jgi:formylmethanofuran dehydrogenase subunit A